jgi:hypothetical protein
MQRAQIKQYSGAMTVGSRKRLTRAVNLLCQAAKPKWVLNPITGQLQYHRLSFITLTISCEKIISTKEAYENLLKPFLSWLRDTKKVKTYIQKLEFQERGQPHYHITTNAFIPYDEIKKVWNSLQRKAGYLDEYAKKHKHFNPNSTDIHSVKNKRNMASYLVKELGKTINAKRLKAKEIVANMVEAGEITEEQRKEFEDQYTGEEMKAMGKVWDCSNNLSGVKYFSVPMEIWHESFLYELIKSNNVREVSDDWYSLLYISGSDPPPAENILNAIELQQLNNYLSSILN